jgi:alpha-ribazole phosphatase
MTLMGPLMSELKVEPGTQLWLIRHGETQWNVDQRVQGHLDVPLSDRGIEQARRLAAWLAEDRLDAVYSSDLQRARVTADVLAEGRLPVWEDPRFREAHFGLFEGLTGPECHAAFPEAYQAWRSASIQFRPPQGETVEVLRNRCMEALAEHLPKHPGQVVAVVCHGGPVRAMVCGLLDLPLEAYGRIRVENTSVARFNFTERGPMLTGFNDVSHLRASTAAPAHAGWEEK